MSHVVIIGGGPAGASLGSYLSLAGIENTIVEKANHPRPHVGESLVTASARVFNEIGFWDTLESSGFVKKYGASWHPAHGEGHVDLLFKDVPLEGVPVDYTYHVDRSRFDLLLLKHAEKLGSTVYQGMGVNRVIFEGDAAVGVECQVNDSTVIIDADVVVDASGRNTLLGRQLGIKERDPVFNQLAVHAWFENVNRGTDESQDNIRIFMLPTHHSWIWQIPISDTVTSIGCVAPADVYKQSDHDVAGFLAEQMEATPELRSAMSAANRINEVKSEGDYSYRMQHFVGDGYMLLGDAARFVDPVFSSGVGVALTSAKIASETLVPALGREDVSASALRPYEEKLREGVSIWYDFISLYYRLAHTFTFFIQDPRHNAQVLELIQGQAFTSEDFPVLAKMREFVEAVEANENHVLRPYLQSSDVLALQ